MKHILILLALVFSMAGVNAQTTSVEAQSNPSEQPTSPEQTFESGLDYYEIGNYTQAFIQFLKSANAGHANAQYSLGVMYVEGLGVVSKDNTEAFYWFEKAAKQNHAWAQFNVGAMYENGLGVEQDNILAYMWFYIAASYGDQLSQIRRNILEKKMSPEQIAQAKDKVRIYFESKYQDGN